MIERRESERQKLIAIATTTRVNLCDRKDCANNFDMKCNARLVEIDREGCRMYAGEEHTRIHKKFVE